ncbi:hypothetical protein CERSUDRAFT_102731 [Gelatoporia subvermispora B]|uniref:XRRM domain-containing protein n=1 Tax=Ceriporiopsis subvermispora (strain B) TaxID=914234 RepID=M2QTD9_CERS8|nr:hypothetical protein CERSUDRAFT_102731 [Gelatoporia subvermispora B]
MFAFVPRKVARPAKPSIVSAPARNRVQPSVVRENPHEIPAEIEPVTNPDVKGKGRAVKEDQTEEDYAILAMLSLSEHILWSDPELRRIIDFNADGYVPLSSLIHHSPYLSKLSPSPNEALLVKAIRAHASEYLDVRVLVSAPSRVAWYGRTNVKEDPGGFEVRRKEDLAMRNHENLSKNDWDARTIYLECIPPQYRSIPGIWRLLKTLLTDGSAFPCTVQAISLPPHHQDKKDDQPKCKGFALVTFAELEDASYLLEHWPWDRRRADQDSDAEEASKYGFRTLSKIKWQALNEGYLSYRKQLLEEIALAEAEEEDIPEPAAVLAEREPTPPQRAAGNSQGATPSMTLSSPYPPGCLVFVRNVHTETNKTTLRALFAQAYAGDSAPLAVGAEGLDYVDFNKGMDTCYLRLATPQHAQLLVEYFQRNHKVQTSGLDTTGADDPPADKKAITAELVQGMREDLYWAKVPEKVRRQAVEKAMTRSSSGRGSEQPATAVPPHDMPDSGEPKRKRRRRKGDA